MIRTFLLSLMLAAMALWSSVSFAAYRWTITQLTNDETDQCEAHIGNDGKVAWSTSCNSDLTGGLYYYDGTSSWPVSESDSLKIWQLDMNDTGSVIWVESGLIASVIMLFDGAEIVMLNIGDYSRINNLGHAVWDTQYPYADREILFLMAVSLHLKQATKSPTVMVSSTITMCFAGPHGIPTQRLCAKMVLMAPPQ